MTDLHRRTPFPHGPGSQGAGGAFLVMPNALRLVRPILETALERLTEDPARRDADLRHLERACGAFKDEANALVAMLIAREVDEHTIQQAEELFGYFGQIEAQIAALIETGRD